MGARNGPHVEPQSLLARAQEDRLDAKKKRFVYAERDAAHREALLRQVSQIEPHNRVYVEEAGVEATRCYPYGWSQRNTRCFGQ